ncbi:quinon protein alcohol dehydrogenase-like superfamily [Lipomyces arxii]|uniref:quinon protein alcohol dehydrogenase-like superfamily n=1 Tax=Lipomyces arxii TaxID=56418 RepID=UPI0034CFDEAF
MSDTVDVIRKSRRHKSKKSTWKSQEPQGGALINCAPVFSEDHRYLAVLTSLELRLYSFPARQCVARVHIDNAYLAVDMYVPRNAGVSKEGYPKIWIATRYGTCVFVDWESEVLKVVKLNQLSVHRIHKIISINDDNFLLAVSETLHDSNISIVHISNGKVASLFDIDNVKRLSVSHTKSHVIFLSTVQENPKKLSTAMERITVLKVVDDEQAYCVSAIIERTRNVSTIAVADNGIVAVGLATGVIELFYPTSSDESPGKLDYRQSSKSYIVRTFKWHLDPVRALSFSLDGNYLLSGGNEKVLLFWQLETGNVQFLPRLPGPITDIVVDNSSTTYALCLGNNFNEIVVLASTDLDARLRITSINARYSNLPPMSQARSTISSKDTFLTSSSLKLLNLNKEGVREREYVSTATNSGVPSFAIFPTFVQKTNSLKSPSFWYLPALTDAQIQIFDPAKGEQVAVQSVARTLQLGKVLFEESIPDPVVTQFVLSSSSQWMATVDETKTQPIDNLLSKLDVQINLKFWSNDSEKDDSQLSWKLNSQIHSPHGPNVPVAALVAAPESYYQGKAFITACHGGGLRLWRPKFPKVQTRQVEWSARHILDPNYSYEISRSSPMFDSESERALPDVSLAWATDGSIVAIGSGLDVYIVAVPTRSTDSLGVVKMLSGVISSPVRGLGFMSTSFIILTESGVTVYNILTADVAWSVGLGSTPKGSQSMITFGRETFCLAINFANMSDSAPTHAMVSNLYVFSPASPVPIFVHRHQRPISAVHSTSVGLRQAYKFIDTNRIFHTILEPQIQPKRNASNAVVDEVAAVNGMTDEPSAGVTAILHLKSGKYTVPDTTPTGGVEVEKSSARTNVVLNPTLLNSVFEGPEYAVGDLDSVFDKLLSAIGQKES